MIAVSPFNSNKKRSAIAIRKNNKVEIHVKGAPETILAICKNKYTEDGVQPMTDDLANIIDENVNQMASKGLRVLSFAFVEMDEDLWTQYKQDKQPEDALEAFIRDQEDSTDGEGASLAFVAAVGLKDRLRPDIKQSINYARENTKMNIRLVSGDHAETAKTMALNAGILKHEDIGRQFTVMEGKEFRQQVGNIISTYDESSQRTITTLERMDEFNRICGNLKVVYRATSEDKNMLVIGLQNIGRKVAVTGSSITDLNALSNSDVGLSMGSGQSVAKNQSSIILTDDDFESSLKAIMWGRNIYNNIMRFLQFQLTVNFSALLTIAFGFIMFAQSPFTSVQLLWINLIMDTLAAIALASEPPIKNAIRGRPYDEQNKIMAPVVWR